MEITVQWLIQQDVLKGMACIAGEKGVHRVIRSINFMDNPDTAPWLKKDELILSTGYLFTSTDLYKHIVADLNERGCCGLGIKMNRYIDLLPKEMLEQANKLGFAIFSIPFSLSMEQIVSLVYRQLFENEMSTSQRIASVYKRTMESVLKKRSLVTVLKNISDAIHSPTFLTDPCFELVERYLPKEFRPQFPFPFCKDDILFPESDVIRLREEYQRHPAPVLNHTIRWEGTDYPFLIFSVLQKKELLGFLICLVNGRPFSASEYQLIDTVKSILSFVLINSGPPTSGLRSNQDLFYSKILSGVLTSESEIRSLCRQYGFNDISSRVCITMRIDGYEPLSIAQRRAFERKIWNLLTPVLNESKMEFGDTVFVSNFVFFLWSTEQLPAKKSEQALNTVNALVKRLAQEGITACAGISKWMEGAATIHASYVQSLNALELGKKLHPKSRVFSYTEDRIYHVISAHFSHTDLTELCGEILKPLETYDAHNGSDLIKTLDEYLKHGQNVTQAAKALFIHRNTMMYRLEQIRQLTNMDTANRDALFTAQFGFYVKKLLSL